MSTIAEKLAAALAESKLALAKVKNVANPEDATGCCAAINRALGKGELDVTEAWTCPKCGTDWKPQMVEGIRVWQAHQIIAIWK